MPLEFIPFKCTLNVIKNSEISYTSFVFIVKVFFFSYLDNICHIYVYSED